MFRISFILLLVACASISMDIPTANGQEKDTMGVEIIGIPTTATIRGEVVEASPEQKPIEGVNVKIVNNATGEEYIILTDINGAYERTGLPAGRYTITATKDGYGDRFGKSKVVAAGGEIFDQIRMRKKDNIVTYIQKNLFTWQSLIIFAIILFIVLILSSLRSRA